MIGIILFTFGVKQPVYFISKMGLFGNNRGIAVWDKQATAKATGKSGKPRRGVEIGVLGGAVINKSPLRKLGVWREVAFLWLSCDSLSLAGLFLSKKKIFPPPAGVVK